MRMHHGDENSQLEKMAESSLTTFSSSDSTSIAGVYSTGRFGGSVKSSGRTGKDSPRSRIASLVAERQASLRQAYVDDPARARSVKWAATVASSEADAFHSVVHIGKGYGVSQRTGIDHSVGGDHDLPNPRDLLCAALAACEDGTIRMIADLLGIPIADLQVEVTGDVDARGCLAIDRAVRVGFRSMTCRVHLRVPADVEPRRIAMLQAHAERACVNIDTLRWGVPVDVVFAVESDALTS
jgi:uncharacterized OsmC-like protein